MRVSSHVIASGRVQGVWFRESMRRRADELGVSGWVRNLSDGRVEAVFEGESDAVARAVAYMREGPPAARVDEVEVSERPASPDSPPEARFEVR